jgi:ribosomal protein S27AE
MRMRIRKPINLFIPVAPHGVIDASAVNPNVGDNTTIRLTNGFIGNGLPFYEASQSGGSLLPTILAELRAINACESYPFFATSEKCITVMDFRAFCVIFHYSYPPVIFIVPTTCAMCYNMSTSYTPPMGTGGLEPPRQLTANSSQSYRACLLHHVPAENQGEGSLPDRPSPESPNINDTPVCPSLSTVNSLNINNNDKINCQGRGKMPICPECFSREMVKFGKYGSQQRWQCTKCGYTTVYPRYRMPKQRKKRL